MDATALPDVSEGWTYGGQAQLGGQLVDLWAYEARWAGRSGGRADSILHVRGWQRRLAYFQIKCSYEINEGPCLSFIFKLGDLFSSWAAPRR